MSSNSLKDLIKEIERRPELYIGQKSLSLLAAFINGWLYRDDASVTDGELLDGFQTWILKKYRVESSHGWSQVIGFYSTSDYQAIDEFFKLFNEFLKEEDHNSDGTCLI